MRSAPKDRHLALYGNVGMIRSKCHDCACMSLVVKGRFLCCDRPYTDDPVEFAVRVCSPEAARKLPSVKARKEILERQRQACRWCGRTFGSSVYFRGRFRRLRVHWDHVLPHAFSQNNHDDNFVAACQYCNAWKSDHIFTDEAQVELFLARKWEATIAKALREVRKGFRYEAQEASFLLRCMQEQGVDGEAPEDETR